MKTTNGSRTPLATPAFNVSGCDDEPIHIPGAIQPHGAFVALSAATGLISHASANLEDYCGFTPDSALGSPSSKLFGDEVGRSIFDACQGLATVQEAHSARARDGTLLHLHAFRSGAYLGIDIEPVRNTSRHEFLLDIAQSIAEPMREAADRVELCELAVSGLKRVLGYDRVMAYRFAVDGHGEVIAEARDPHLESYLGLRYPAADIPPQARSLYLRNPVGAIADSRYVPVPLVFDPSDRHAPLDLTMSTLRSVSPVHLEYMRNMGTAASLTIGLPGRDGLWGMLVCHHAMPRTTGPGHRAIAGIVGQVVSLLLQTIGTGEASVERLERDSLLRTLMRKLSAPVPLLDAMRASGSELMGVVGATGALVQYEGELAVLGIVPPLQSAKDALATLLVDAPEGFLALDALAERYPALAACTEAGSGALFISRRNEAGDAILWFRPEITQTVKWGGNPSDHGHADAGRMSPRTSFAAWSDTVSGHARAWSEVDLAVARDLGFALSAEVGRRAKAELARLRFYDALTGLPNRSLLNERLAEMQGDAVALLFFDLDRFKAVNDTLGHAAGDALLIEVARRVSVVLGTRHFAARLGGDEFVVLGRMDAPDAMQVARAIRETVSVPFDIGGKTCNVSASIGIAFAGQCGRFNLVQAADMAMYASKQGGGNRATAFDAAMYDRAARELELQQDLRDALQNDELLLLYQPVYSLEKGRSEVVAFEALLRWNHPGRGGLRPEEVIALAEKLGLIVPLGQWVLAKAVQAGRQLQQAFGGALSILVNVSALELVDEAYRTHLQTLLQTHDYAPATLCLEVTEDTLHDAAAITALEALRTLGVRIAIDEFGIGYSSISYLRRLPVDVVKLDGSFLANVEGDKRASAFISAVIALAHSAGMAVVVEGVETRTQLDIAANAGADMAQGCMFASPLALDVALVHPSGNPL